ncbi:hypothetical protein SCLCIDRAFT_1183779 [Scleroderma citrinum Foug A]|uniref:Uncharacterized protein n=1 Tax=Scleroderma citrinum Foug A TaxID=1036808 RepID=A0A0C3DW15_9AGAM|nr:hypothetical protein SCLCIDRAFT_1183779 [Scleroderma citrinum Foug A]
MPINENFSKLEEEYNQWVNNFPLFGVQECTVYKGEQLPLFVSLCFPTAKLEALHAMVTYMTVIIFLDHKTAALYIAAFDNPAASLAVWASTVVGAEYRLDYLQENAAFTRATVQEVVERQAKEVDKAKPTLEMYLLNCRNSVTTRTFFVYVQVINGFKVPKELWGDPTVQALKHTVTDVNLIGNVLGLFVVIFCQILVHTKHPLLQKELIADGVSHNILTVLMQDSSIACSDLRQAIDCTSNLLVEALDRFNECRA